jgi:hypothetical protein
MSESRHVLGRRGQLLIALPATVKRGLGLTAGALVFWHVVRKGEAVLALDEKRAGGRPRAEASCSRCEERERELMRLRNALQSRDAADGARYFGQGYQAALRHEGSLGDRLDVALDFLRELLGRKRARGSRRPGREEKSSPPMETPAASDERPPPDPPRPPALVEGGEVASGAQPPGHPL